MEFLSLFQTPSTLGARDFSSATSGTQGRLRDGGGKFLIRFARFLKYVPTILSESLAQDRNFCARFSDVIWRENKPVIASPNVGSFLRLHHLKLYTALNINLKCKHSVKATSQVCELFTVSLRSKRSRASSSRTLGRK